MRLALVTLSLALLCAAQPALARTQSTNPTTTSIEVSGHPRGSRTIPQRLAAERLLVGGIGTLVGTWLLNAAITAIASLGSTSKEHAHGVCPGCVVTRPCSRPRPSRTWDPRSGLEDSRSPTQERRAPHPLAFVASPLVTG
jgi:hypothetical protein